MPFFPASSLPRSSLPTQTLGTIFSAILCLLDQPTPLFELTADQPRAPRVLRISPQRWSCCRPALHPSHTYLSLGFHFHCSQVAPESWVTSLRSWGRVAQGTGQRQNQRGGHALFQDVQKSSPDECGKALGSSEAATALGKNLNQALVDLHALDSAGADAHLGDFRENHLLDDEKPIEKIRST
ncbi:unnamed protein product [Gulo gulo]|uniref:Ferritin light chain n=1 Tax=Gulo gulo TaxID=48420 RepID=A0A9X9M0A2_GULGU|nr:unnamed protein product [Gulo gulo]